MKLLVIFFITIGAIFSSDAVMAQSNPQGTTEIHREVNAHRHTSPNAELILLKKSELEQKTGKSVITREQLELMQKAGKISATTRNNYIVVEKLADLLTESK